MPPFEQAQISFFQLATQYYASGRFASLGGILPVAANLLHHAVEMYLKGALAPSFTLDEMRSWNHRLPAIWKHAKLTFVKNNLSRFDPVVDRLDPFEHLRYPDRILREGAQIQFVRLRSELLPSLTNPPRNIPAYDLVLEEVDELVKELFAVAKMNPPFFFEGLSPRVISTLNEANQHAIFDV